MNERRDFLKVASLLPLGVLTTGASAITSSAEGEQRSARLAAPILLDAPLVIEQTPAPQEQEFPDYHLLGKPDPTTNLFGPTRPQDWRATKDSLLEALRRTAHENDPIFKWVATFTPTFDDRATRVVLDAVPLVHRADKPAELTYEPQLYDSSLRSLSVLLDRCLRYRNEMGGFESAGVNAGIAYLTFMKLRPIQHNFIIQSSSADITDIEQNSEGRASQIFSQAKGLDRLFDKYHLQGLQAEAAGEAAEAGLAGAKDRLLTRLLEKQFHFQVDAQLAQFTRLLSPGSSSNVAERYLRMLHLLTEDLADAYCKAYSISKGVQQTVHLTRITIGTAGPIDVDIPLFGSQDALRKWVQQVAPADDNGQRQPDILDALLLWTRAVIRELDRRSQYETEFTVAIPLNQPSGKNSAPILTAADISAAFGPNKPSNKLTFALTDKALPFAVLPTNLRVAAIGLSVEHSQDDASPLQYSTGFPHTPSNPVVAVNSTPAASQEPTSDQIRAAQVFELPKMSRLNATAVTPPQTVQGVGTYQRPALYLPSVRLQGGSGGDFEPVLSGDPAARNISPFGNWTIYLDPSAVAYYQSIAQISDNWITGVILHLRLRGTVS